MTASRSSWNRWFHGAFGTYLTTQFFLYSTNASESLERRLMLSAAVVMAATVAAGVWQQVAIWRAKRALARRPERHVSARREDHG